MAITLARDWSPERNQYMTHETQYAGCIITTRERNYYDDSDFYAVVWDDDEERVKEVEYSTTRFASGNSASVDITPKNAEKARQWLINSLTMRYTLSDKTQAERPEVGKNVIVFKGRKVRIGTEGRVFWKGEDQYYRGPGVKHKVGIETKEGTRYFTSADNCKATCPWEYETGTPIIREILERETLMDLTLRWISIPIGMVMM